MPIKVTYKFTRLFKEVQEQVDFFNKTMQNIIQQYGEKDENGEFVLTENKSGVMIKKDKYDECMEKVNELNNLEIDLQYNPIFTLDELDGLDLSVGDLSKLMAFISE